jgi:DNA-directed RNA polymerase subunit RPC12/RpoP
MADLKARPAQAGTRRTCPRCQFRFKVPSAEEAERLAAMRRAAGEYALGDAEKPSDRQYVSIRCRVCATRFDAAADQLGQEIACPDCGTLTVVRPPLESPPKPKAVPAYLDDEYALCEGIHQPDASHKLVYQTYIRLLCPVCGTRLLATLDQVGQKIVCPDCQVATTVPPPPETKKPPDAEDQQRRRHEEYLLTPDAATDSPDAASETAGRKPPTYVKVECRHCHTRLPATTDEIGRQIVCPDCGTSTVVPEPKARSPGLPPELDPSEEYVVGASFARPEYRHIKDYRQLGKPPEERANAASDDAPPIESRSNEQSAPGSRPADFQPGLLRFLRYDGVWQRWVGLSAVAVPVLLVLAGGANLATRVASGLTDAPIVVGAMAMLTAGGVIALVWSAPAAAILLVVIQETSEGTDRIEEWPEGLFTEWMFGVLFIFNSLGAATFAGVMLRGVLREYCGIPFWPAMPITIVVLFPVLLLSMLETGSALNPVSLPVWRSMRSAWPAWAGFYVESGLLAAAGVATAMAAAWPAGLWGAALVSPVLIGMALVYARLLGRLGWACRSAAAG